MPIIEHRAIIRCDQATAFHAAQDYAQRERWDPFFSKLARSETKDGKTITTVTAWHGATMQVEYVAWKPPERAAIRMVSGSRLLQSFAGTWMFLVLAPDQTEVRFRYQIKAARAWVWLQPVMCGYFGWETRRRLAALRRYLESATTPTPGKSA